MTRLPIRLFRVGGLANRSGELVAPSRAVTIRVGSRPARSLVLLPVVIGLGYDCNDVLDFAFEREATADGKIEDRPLAPYHDVLDDDGAHEPNRHRLVLAAKTDPSGRAIEHDG